MRYRIISPARLARKSPFRKYKISHYSVRLTISYPFREYPIENYNSPKTVYVDLVVEDSVTEVSLSNHLIPIE